MKKEMLEQLNTALASIERQCTAANVDVRPWVSADHELSIQHWKLGQRKLRRAEPKPVAVKSKRKPRTLSPEQIAAMMKGKAAARTNRIHPSV